MATECPTPSRVAIRDLLADLLQRKVDVSAPQAPHVLVDARRSYAAGYRRDDGTPGAACVWDLDAALAAGAAIGAVPINSARDEVNGSGDLNDDLRESLHEVVNIFARLLNSPTSPHVVLRELHPVPGEVPVDLARVIVQPRAREDYTIRIDGYGAGTVTVLIA